MLEETFLLMYYGGFTYDNVYLMPVEYRRWFINRINKEISDSQGGGDSPEGNPRSRAFHHNTPEMNALQNNHRTFTPARLNRA